MNTEFKEIEITPESRLEQGKQRLKECLREIQEIGEQIERMGNDAHSSKFISEEIDKIEKARSQLVMVEFYLSDSRRLAFLRKVK